MTETRLAYRESVESLLTFPFGGGFEAVTIATTVIAVPVALLNFWAGGTFNQPRILNFFARGPLFFKETYVNWLNIGICIGVPVGLGVLIQTGFESQHPVDYSRANQIESWHEVDPVRKWRELAKATGVGTAVVWGGSLVATPILSLFLRARPLKWLASVTLGLSTGLVICAIPGRVLGALLTERRQRRSTY